MNTISRIAPVRLSQEQIDNQTTQAQFKAGYGFYTVKSKFIGDKTFSDLLFEIILTKHEKNFLLGRHEI